jgi:hypothetical protein
MNASIGLIPHITAIRHQVEREVLVQFIFLLALVSAIIAGESHLNDTLQLAADGHDGLDVRVAHQLIRITITISIATSS